MRVLHGPAITLEPQVVAHADEMFRVLSDPAIYEYENAPPASLDGLRDRYRRLESRVSADGSEQWLNWVIRIENGALAGYVQATVYANRRALVAYELASCYWGRGLARAAVSTMVTELADSYGVRRLDAIAVARNHRSLRLLERLGFTPASAADHAHHGIDPAEVLWSRAAPGPDSGAHTNPLDERVHVAHGDAWQAAGRLRALQGGGAAEWPGVRLMSSGLPYRQWNSGDLLDLARFDLAAVRAWYAARASGAGVPWGICVAAGLRFPHGRFAFTQRCMALIAAAFAPAPLPAGVTIRTATPDELRIAAGIDAAAFDANVAETLPWLEPQIGAHGFTVALARLDGVPVGIATAVETDDRAGRCAAIFGVGVLAPARGRGIGAALTTWLLRRSFEAGATLAHLNPNTDAAARVYARLGFVETAGLDIYIDL